MSAKIKPNPHAVVEAAGPVPAGAVLEADAGESVCDMFEAFRLTTEGAFLAGGLLLEVDEEFTVEFDLDSDKLRILARVAQVCRDDEPGMIVTFVDVSDPDRTRLEQYIHGANTT